MQKIIPVLPAAVFILFMTSSRGPATGVTANDGYPDAPEAVFEQEVIDYGTIEYDSDGEREFKFKNTGKAPLIIYSATPSCGCTVPVAPKEPIKPGETGVIKVHYNTKLVGAFEKTITVSSNGKVASQKLRIRGTVKAAPTTGDGKAFPADTPVLQKDY